MRTTWEDEGVAHRASLTVQDSGVAVLFVTRIRGSALGETATLYPEDRRALAAALLEGLPLEDETAQLAELIPGLSDEFLFVPRSALLEIES